MVMQQDQSMDLTPKTAKYFDKHIGKSIGHRWVCVIIQDFTYGTEEVYRHAGIFC